MESIEDAKQICDTALKICRRLEAALRLLSSAVSQQDARKIEDVAAICRAHSGAIGEYMADVFPRTWLTRVSTIGEAASRLERVRAISSELEGVEQRPVVPTVDINGLPVDANLLQWMTDAGYFHVSRDMAELIRRCRATTATGDTKRLVDILHDFVEWYEARDAARCMESARRPVAY